MIAIRPSEILLVGCGKMGGAMLSGWHRSTFLDAHNVTVVTPNPDTAKRYPYPNTKFYTTADQLPSDYRPDMILFAVKPQMMDAVAADMASRYVSHQPTVISVAAGKTTGYFSQFFGLGTDIVRAMPNTPGLVGAGITALYANREMPDTQQQLVNQLFSALGSIVWLKDEQQMDVAAAISGSGPAYLFHIMDCLRDAGIQLGLPEDVATRLAIATVHGTGALAFQTEDSPEMLRRNVTSPGGMTEAALKVLLHNDAQNILIRNAVLAAVQRAKELA